MKPIISNDRTQTPGPHPEEAALFARPSRRMAPGTISLVAVLRDARKSALLRTRLMDDFLPAHIPERLLPRDGVDERFFGFAQPHDVAVLRESEAHDGLLLVGVIEEQRLVVDDLDDRVELLDLHRDRDRRGGDVVVEVNIDGVFARHDAANADEFLTDRERDLL